MTDAGGCCEKNKPLDLTFDFGYDVSMQVTADNKEALRIELDQANREMLRCMGGVDPQGCVAASRRVTELRLALRDDQAMIAHFARVMTRD